jgi:hypothetical protein
MSLDAVSSLQSIDEINAIVSLKTGWVVEESVSPTKITFLKVFGPDGRGGRSFLTSLPRATEADVICAFSEACRHYYELGQKVPAAIGRDLGAHLRVRV